MFFANDTNGEKVEATPNAIGFCPSCEEQLLAKCGELKLWHWSHIGKRDCDDWYEPETEWHLGWKKLFGKENCEIVIPPHRADILGNLDVVIELQHSNISIEEIKKREDFYKNRNENSQMFWIVDAHPFAENLFFQKNPIKEIKNGEESWSANGGWWYNGKAEYVMSWRRKQERWLPMVGAQMPVMLDLSQQEVSAGIGFLHGKEDYPDKDSQIIKDSLFWMRGCYFESDEYFPNPYLIGGSFVSKKRILERYKPTTKF